MFRNWLCILTIFVLWRQVCAMAGEPMVYWHSIDSDTDAYDSMMERAAFLDVPRRDLLSVVKGFSNTPDNSRDSQIVARKCFWKAWVLYRENTDSAADLICRAIQLCDSAAFPYDHLRFSLLQADINRLHGRLAESYATYRSKLQLLRKFGDRMWQGKVYVTIGAIMQELGEYHEAMRNFEEGQQLFKAIGSEACHTKNRINIANIHYLLGDRQAALDCLEGLEENAFVVADSIYLANVLVSRFRISDCSDSIAVTRAYDISQHLSNDPLSVLTMMSMGMLRFLQHNYKDGKALLTQAFDIANHLEDYSCQRDILAGLEDCCRALGQSAEADRYHTRWKEINDSLYHHERNDRIRRAEHLATINRYERRMAEESQAAHWRFTLAMSICGSLLIIMVLSLWLMWMWRRRSESERRLKEEENERLTLLNRQYSLEIEAKEKELASTTVLMAQKNTQLKDLSRQIESLEKKGLATTHTDPLKQTITQQLTADDDWRYFKLRFDKVHPGFFEIMKDRYPSLSKTDLRLCAYIRVGMTAKEIAQVLSVKPDTVNTSRYRIRKKMQLTPDASLEQTIESIG